jgi:hypothetical protein
MAQITLNSTGVASNGTLALQTNGTTPALTIDASQNVGIGTGSPSSLLTVNGEANISAVLFKQNVAAYTTGFGNPVIARASGFTGVYASGSLLLQARSDAAADIAFITGTTPAERMRINSAGDVGIGTPSPQAALDLGDATGGRAITWGGPAGTARYTSIFSSQSSASLVLARGFTGSTSTDTYVSTVTGTIANSGIRLDSNGFINFFTDASSSQTEDNAFTPTPRMRIDTSGNLQVQTGAVMPYAPAPASISGAATLTNANIRAQIINTTGTTYTVTMALGTTLETLASWATTGIGYDFYIVNTASGTITLDATEVGVTSVGTMTIATGVSAQFRIRRTAANTFVVYRLG